ncbi:hypothetical protein L7F22_056998 [Adiantum nelumboides]|nr:hypothetical protein [Adiantum nelumboides]
MVLQIRGGGSWVSRFVAGPQCKGSTTDRRHRELVILPYSRLHFNLKKPFLFGEFGVSSNSANFKRENRVNFLSSIYTVLYISALGKGAAAGSLLWQLFPKGMENFIGGYQLVLSEDQAVAQLVKQHAERLAALTSSAYREHKGGMCPTMRFKCW